jgi:ribonuclease D
MASAKIPETLLPRRFSPRRRFKLIAAIERGLRLPPDAQPHQLRSRGRRSSEAEQRRFRDLRQRRDRLAVELKLDPTLIASRSTLALLAEDWEKHQTQLMQWQRELLQD